MSDDIQAQLEEIERQIEFNRIVTGFLMTEFEPRDPTTRRQWDDGEVIAIPLSGEPLQKGDKTFLIQKPGTARKSDGVSLFGKDGLPRITPGDADPL